MDALDKHCHTPLLLATSRGAWRTASFLIQRGASHGLKDDKNRNLMHLMVLSGGNVNILGVDISAVNTFFFFSRELVASLYVIAIDRTHLCDWIPEH